MVKLDTMLNWIGGCTLAEPIATIEWLPLYVQVSYLRGTDLFPQQMSGIDHSHMRVAEISAAKCKPGRQVNVKFIMPFSVALYKYKEGIKMGLSIPYTF